MRVVPTVAAMPRERGARGVWVRPASAHLLSEAVNEAGGDEAGGFGGDVAGGKAGAAGSENQAGLSFSVGAEGGGDLIKHRRGGWRWRWLLEAGGSRAGRYHGGAGNVDLEAGRRIGRRR